MNIDPQTVEDFGLEWEHFNQSTVSTMELESQFNKYFNIFPWKLLPDNAVGMDVGCGSGRFAKMVAKKVGKLHCIDASRIALKVAENNIKNNNISNCEFHNTSVDQLPFDDNSLDFGYSLGVLHHIPDTLAGIKSCVQKLKVNAPFLIYLYYRFDNRPFWFTIIWKISDLLRQCICKLPFKIKLIFAYIIGILVYYPLAKISFIAKAIGLNSFNIPLSCYKNASLYTMKTDALDRFGTKIEKRFTREEIASMLNNAGLTNIHFSNTQPFWCAVGFKYNVTCK